MPASEAKKKATKKHIAENYYKTTVLIKNDRAAEMRDHISRSGESINAFVNRAILCQIDRDNAVNRT